MTRTFRSHPGKLLGASTIALLCGLAGCAHHAARPPAAAPPPAPAAPVPGQANAAGVWDWVHRSQNEQGDLRIEQEEWHLDQEGGHLSGYYDRQVVTLSTDQRPFRCNGALGFTRTSRVRVTGQVRGGQIVLREVGADAPPQPCDSGPPPLLSYVGQVQGDSLRLNFAPGGTQFLTRRPAGSPAPAASSAEAAPRGAPLSGTWEWQLQTVDAEGDLRTEREEWHLQEADAEVGGYYERTVERRRPGGTFSCNAAPVVNTVTRYTVRGQRFGDHVALSEIDYKAQPGPCDNALRRLDSYRGALSPTGDELLLSWGSGSQLLRRKPGADAAITP